jgi:3-phenylpropionate/cinnamic acid dioxygenase small subunit
VPASVEDRLELQDLGHAYATAIDERDADRLVGLFTDDGHFGVHLPGVDEPFARFDGRDEIRTLMGMLEPYGDTMHLMTNHRVDVEGNTATGVVYCLAHHLTERNDTLEDLVMAIRYVDRYERTLGGWRIADRRCVRYWTELRPVLADRAAF